MCKQCGAAIVWCRHRDGRAIPADAATVHAETAQYNDQQEPYFDPTEHENHRRRCTAEPPAWRAYQDP